MTHLLQAVVVLDTGVPEVVPRELDGRAFAPNEGVLGFAGRSSAMRLCIARFQPEYTYSRTRRSAWVLGSSGVTFTIVQTSSVNDASFLGRSTLLLSDSVDRDDFGRRLLSDTMNAAAGCLGDPGDPVHRDPGLLLGAFLT